MLAKQENFELTSPLSLVFRKTVPLKAGETILQGQWFVLDTNGEAALSGATPSNVCYLSFIDSSRPDVQDTLPDGNPVSTGGMAGLMGAIEGFVNNNGYDDGQSYTKDAALTVKNGKLTPAASGEQIFAYVKVAIGADGLLHFTGNSGFALSVAP
jgi:hypothetical protein